VANGTESDAVYGAGDFLTISFDAPTDMAPGLWITGQPGMLASASVAQLLACHVTNSSGAEVATALGEVTGQWTSDTTLRVTVANASTAGAALLARGAATPAGVGSLVCCAQEAGGLRSSDSLSKPSDTCSDALVGDWGSLDGPTLRALTLHAAHNPDGALAAGDALSLHFSEPTDMGGAPLGWALDAATLAAGLAWTWPPYGNGTNGTAGSADDVDARWYNSTTLVLTLLAPPVPSDAAEAARVAAPCDGSLGVSVRAALGVRDAAQASNPSITNGTLGGPSAAAAAADCGGHAAAAELRVWGSATHHALGLGGATAASAGCAALSSAVATPQPLPFDWLSGAAGQRVVSVAASRLFSVVVLADGTGYAWGSRLLGATTIETPRSLARTDLVGVAAGWEHALLLSSDGTVRGLGADALGQLGGVADAATPQLLSLASGGGALPTIRLIAAGAQHSLLVSDGDGDSASSSSGSGSDSGATAVYAFGNDDAGQLGDLDPAAASASSSSSSSDAPPPPPPPGGSLPTPLAATWLDGAATQQLAAGRYHSLALMRDGSVCAWGASFRGQLGGIGGVATGATTAGLGAAPCANLTQGAVTAIAAGDEHSLAVTASGALVSWGSGAGAAGTASADVPTPTVVALAAGGAGGGGAVGGDAFVVAVDGGEAHSLAATATGELYAWGAHGFGQLGVGCDEILVGAGSAAAHAPALVADGAGTRGALHAWRAVASTALSSASAAWLSPLTDLGAAAAALRDTPLTESLRSAVGATGTCRAACEAEPGCGGFVHTAAATDAAADAAVDCAFYAASAPQLFAASAAAADDGDADGGAVTLHLYESLGYGGASLVAAGGAHSLVAPGLGGGGDGVGGGNVSSSPTSRCPSEATLPLGAATGVVTAVAVDGDGSGLGGVGALASGEACGGAARGVCAFTECRCVGAHLGEACGESGCASCDGAHGSCALVGAASYACVCDAGWAGDDCTTPTCDAYGGLECAGHGVCTAGDADADASDDDDDAHTCACDAGWYGLTCALPLCDGALAGCTGRGACKCAQGGSGSGALLAACAADGTEAAQCVCDAGWLGAACDAPCPTSRGGAVCGGHGSCVLDGDAAVCSCDELWDGSACEQPLCPGTPECGGDAQGSCVLSYDDLGASGASCACATRWGSANCSTMECPNGCSGHGSCAVGDDGVPACECDSGYKKDDCSDGVGRRTLIYGLAFGGTALLLLLCTAALLRCLHLLSSGGMDGPGDAMMRQRWQRAHVTPGRTMVAVHVPTRKKVLSPV